MYAVSVSSGVSVPRRQEGGQGSPRPEHSSISRGGGRQRRASCLHRPGRAAVTSFGRGARAPEESSAGQVMPRCPAVCPLCLRTGPVKFGVRSPGSAESRSQGLTTISRGQPRRLPAPGCLSTPVDGVGPSPGTQFAWAQRPVPHSRDSAVFSGPKKWSPSPPGLQQRVPGGGARSRPEPGSGPQVPNRSPRSGGIVVGASPRMYGPVRLGAGAPCAQDPAVPSGFENRARGFVGLRQRGPGERESVIVRTRDRVHGSRR